MVPLSSTFTNPQFNQTRDNTERENFWWRPRVQWRKFYLFLLTLKSLSENILKRFLSKGIQTIKYHLFWLFPCSLPSLYLVLTFHIVSTNWKSWEKANFLLRWNWIEITSSIKNDPFNTFHHSFPISNREEPTILLIFHSFMKLFVRRET